MYNYLKLSQLVTDSFVCSICLHFLLTVEMYLEYFQPYPFFLCKPNTLKALLVFLSSSIFSQTL